MSRFMRIAFLENAQINRITKADAAITNNSDKAGLQELSSARYRR